MTSAGSGYPMGGGDRDAGQAGSAQVRQQSAVALGVREPQDVGAPVGAPQPAQPRVSVAAAADGGAEGSAEPVEVRCPIGRGGLLLKLLGRGEAHVDGDNLIEVACRSCRDDARRERPNVTQVLHRFGMDGAHVETVETRAGDV